MPPGWGDGDELIGAYLGVEGESSETSRAGIFALGAESTRGRASLSSRRLLARRDLRPDPLADRIDRLAICEDSRRGSDASARRLAKGPGRPIVPARDRAIVMAALRRVGHVTILGEDTPLETIRLLKPDFLVKGSDRGAITIVGSDDVRSWGGRVVRVKVKSGYSTTGIVEKIRSAV